jgi:hypothetical protein
LGNTTGFGGVTKVLVTSDGEDVDELCDGDVGVVMDDGHLVSFDRFFRLCDKNNRFVLFVNVRYILSILLYFTLA